MQWDFWTLTPESAHQVTWLMGDRGIPKTWRHMNGYSSHTYLWVNADGERFWVKYHFKTDQGIECLTQQEAAADPDTYPYVERWAASGEFVRAAYTSRQHDDDFIKAGTLVREIMDDAQRQRLVSNAAGHLMDGVTQPVLERALQYWRNIDQNIGDGIAKRQSTAAEPSSPR